MSPDRERFEGVVFPFVAELCRRFGEDPAAISSSANDDATVVVCENGNVYRVTMSVAFQRVAGDVEPEVHS